MRAKLFVPLAVLPVALFGVAVPAQASTHTDPAAVHVALDPYGVAESATLAYWTAQHMLSATPLDQGEKPGVKADVTPTTPPPPNPLSIIPSIAIPGLGITPAPTPSAPSSTTGSSGTAGHAASRTAGRTAARTAKPASKPMSVAAAGIPTRSTWSGSPVVGALFSNDGHGNHYCTASVINSSKHNLILTAAHCLYDPGHHSWHKNAAFVPHYWHGHSPYGVWPLQMMTTDGRWQRHGDQDLDFAFATVSSVGGRSLEGAVGGHNWLDPNQGYNNSVLVTGYPMKKYASIDDPIYCYTNTYKQAKYQIGMACHGFYGGTSGGPWIKHYNSRCRCGPVMGVVGGYQEGGKYDYISYSPVFDRDIMNLYRETLHRS